MRCLSTCAAWVLLLIGLFFQFVSVSYSSDSRNSVVPGVVAYITSPAGSTGTIVGLSMLAPVDLASLWAPLLVLTGVRSSPEETTATFKFYLLVAAKIWAVVTLTRLAFSAIWFSIILGSAGSTDTASSLMLFGVWVLTLGEVFVLGALNREAYATAGRCCCSAAGSCGCCNKGGNSASACEKGNACNKGGSACCKRSCSKTARSNNNNDCCSSETSCTAECKKNESCDNGSLTPTTPTPMTDAVMTSGDEGAGKRKKKSSKKADDAAAEK